MKSRCKELPEELWESILDRLVLNDYYGDLKSPSLVCKQFLSITNRLRHKFVARGYKWCDALSRALERFRNLKEIALYPKQTLPDVESSILKIAYSGLDLQSLCFRSFPISPSADSFRRLGCTMSNLKVLRCTRFGSLSDPDLVHIADAVPRLEELDIQYPTNEFEPSEDRYPELSNHMVTDAGIKTISLKLQGLRRINISGIEGCSDRSLIALSSNCVHLNEIHCCRSRITRGGIYWVLCHSTNLTSLHAVSQAEIYGSSTNSSFTYDDLKICATGLRELIICDSMVHQERLVCSIAKAGILLEKLELGSSYDLNINGFTTMLRACPTLKHFKLCGEYLVNHNEISEICRCLPNIISIYLDCCSSLMAIFSVFAKECPALSKITLRVRSIIGPFKLIQDDFVLNQVRYLDLSSAWRLNDKLLKEIVTACPNLHTLEVEGCPWLTKEGLEEILKCCPQIKHLRSAKLRGSLSE
ncbi:hypothetical protein Vadar_014825 [Vaccinium darrowii]|uniref:Uncharacterized protein n=1 Tax=Vaccinium darrowii TaxID=229202 RepID=A0ACB7ZJK9_9ERIC|nr:hypothetical protein Vadar_014825 [Vaccinium darrowii]